MTVILSILAITGWVLYLISNTGRIKEDSDRAFYLSMMRAESKQLLQERKELRDRVEKLETAAAEQKREMVDILRKYLEATNEYAWYRVMVRAAYADGGVQADQRIAEQKRRASNVS